jgi:hypothetical protein
MLELVGLETAKRRLRPGTGGGIAPAAAERRDAPLDQLAQVNLEGGREFSIALEGSVGADEHAPVGKMPLPKPVQRPKLLQLLLAALGVLRIHRGRLLAPINEKIRGTALLGSLQGILELPLDAGYGRARVHAAVLADCGTLRQRCSEARPNNQDDHFEGARWLDRVLEMPRSDHRLELPEVWLDVEEPRIVLRQALNRQRSDLPCCFDVPGRGNKDATSTRQGAHNHS